MTKILSKMMLIILGSTILTGCLPNPFFGSCANWNCTRLNPYWEKRMERCREQNVKNLGSNIIDLNKSSMGNQITSKIYDRCIVNNAKYDARTDSDIKNMLLKLEHGK